MGKYLNGTIRNELNELTATSLDKTVEPNREGLETMVCLRFLLFECLWYAYEFKSCCKELTRFREDYTKCYQTNFDDKVAFRNVEAIFHHSAVLSSVGKLLKDTRVI
jgi:hypothetical protein